MNRAEVFNAIVSAFKNKYSWLGEQFAEELLYIVAAQNMQEHLSFDDEDIRLRSHLLLFWPAGWFKSTLLKRAYILLGSQNCDFLSDITTAALRGSLDRDSDGNVVFIPPKCKVKPFLILTELGTVTSKQDKELVQIFLQVLEEGIVTVDLVKFAALTEDQKREIESALRGIMFSRESPSTMIFITNCSILAATYNHKFVVDSAFSSRWDIMIPKQPFTSSLSAYVRKHRFRLEDEFRQKFREIIKSKPSNSLVDAWYEDLPKEIEERDEYISPRIMRSLLAFKLARLFWELEVNDQMLIDRFNYLRQVEMKVNSTLEDNIIDLLRKEGPMDFDQLKEKLHVPSRELLAALRGAYHISKLRDENGRIIYSVKA
jgi:hypothetical protein